MTLVAAPDGVRTVHLPPGTGFQILAFPLKYDANSFPFVCFVSLD